ncbi:M20 family metallo-hydrolase [Methylorubrum populi]|uniref:M20 family metallo-hydrolase n=1 Tax=Methylorubrum TaxID=2282523 RepID=UPI00114DD2EB|nr:M20 family metallo-hydrolase [Methylorubrum populi]QDI83575.1 M20 family metallo-hydrolase [Methylorubrum populi]
MEVLHGLIERFAAIGGTGDGGVCRLTGTELDKEARDLLKREMESRGLTPRIDQIGNMFGIANIVPSSNDIIIVGSHLDSQPTGGRFDGVYGVLAGLVAVDIVRNRSIANPGVARRNLAVANWTNEEGSRFQPSLTGSSVFTGAMTLQDGYACKDAEGTTLGEALSDIGYIGETPLEHRPVRYVEVHVEQGDVMERAGAEIAAVTGAWMTRKISVVFEGDYSHSGPTPMKVRRDALRAAARAIDTLYREVDREDVGAHASAARISVYPNSPNVVAGHVQVWFEVRHEDEALVERICDRFLHRIEGEAAEIGVGISIAANERRSCAELDKVGADVIHKTAEEMGFKTISFKTPTGHDALAIQKLVPSSLIFVPSVGGLSHNPREFTHPKDLENGLAVLIEVLWKMVSEE